MPNRRRRGRRGGRRRTRPSDMKWDSTPKGRVLTLSRQVLNPNQVVRARLVDYVQLQATAGGVLGSFIAHDPSTFTSGEWADWKLLFSECRIVGSRLSVSRGSSITNIRPVAIAGTLSTTTAPTAYLTVLDNPRSITYIPATDTTAQGVSLGLKYAQKPQWADVSNPDPGAFAGCPGGYGIYGDGLGANVQTIEYMIEVEVEFRNRF